MGSASGFWNNHDVDTSPRNAHNDVGLNSSWAYYYADPAQGNINYSDNGLYSPHGTNRTIITDKGGLLGHSIQSSGPNVSNNNCWKKPVENNSGDIYNNVITIQLEKSQHNLPTRACSLSSDGNLRQQNHNQQEPGQYSHFREGKCHQTDSQNVGKMQYGIQMRGDISKKPIIIQYHSQPREIPKYATIPYGDRKQQRFEYTDPQRALLEDIFVYIRYPTCAQKRALAKRLNITPNQVKIWFQNRRRKDIVVRDKDEGIGEVGRQNAEVGEVEFSDKHTVSHLNLFYSNNRPCCNMLIKPLCIKLDTHQGYL